jgi:hypothetical protein
MKHISNAMVFAFKEILRWNAMKFILAGGLFATLLWLSIGYAVWDVLVGMGAKIIELVPFSMVRSNGAWMLSTFLWLQVTLLSFALFFAFFGNVILRSVSKERYTMLSVAALVISALFWGLVWWAEGDYIHAQLVRLLTWLPFETVEKGIAALIAINNLYNGVIISVLFLAILFTPALIKEVEIREFREDTVDASKMADTFGYTLKDTLIFLVASVVAFPLLFVPVLNVITQIALWIWLYKDTLAHSAALFVEREEKAALLKAHRGAIWFLTFVAVLFNFVPVVNIFGPVFGIVAIFYYLRTL